MGAIHPGWNAAGRAGYYGGPSAWRELQRKHSMRQPVRLLLFIAILPSAGTSQSSPVSAPAVRCGWYAPPEGDRLPAHVEAIIAHLPAAWTDAAPTIERLNAWYQRCDAGAARQAIFDLKRASERFRTDQAVSALLGTALLHGPEVQIEGASGITNRPTYRLSNAERDGARLLADAASDPRFPMAALELAEVAIATHHPPTAKAAFIALKRVTDRDPSPAYWRLAAEVALSQKDYALALNNASRAIALGDSAAFHTAGIAGMMSGDTAGVATYLRGMDAPAALDLYYDDISYLLQPDDTVTWHRLEPAARGAWLRKQWEWRAATSSQSVGERLELHFERLTYALDYYQRTAFRTPPNSNAVTFDTRTRRMTIDDRGLIHVRHGAPDEVIRATFKNVDDTRVAWGYNRLMDGRTLFEFTKKECPDPPYGSRLMCVNVGDYYLATPLGCQEGGDAMVTYIDYGAAIGRYDPALGLFMATCMMLGPGATELISRHALDRRNAINEGLIALRTESAAPPLKDPLDATFMTYAMRSDNATELFGFTGIAGEHVTPRNGTNEYALRVLMSVEHAAAFSVQTVDTTLTFNTAGALQRGAVVGVSVALRPTPSADATVRLTIRNQYNSAQGQIITTARAIPDLSGSGFALSDVVIAEARDGSWRRGSARLAPIPAHYVGAGTTFRLYNEVYGASTGDSLAVEITIAPGTDDNIGEKLKSLINRRHAIRIAFSERALVDGSGTARMLREIPADVEAGRYVVTVAVTNGRTGAHAQAQTTLTILQNRP
jgi:hypothetical protein